MDSTPRDPGGQRLDIQSFISPSPPVESPRTRRRRRQGGTSSEEEYSLLPEATAAVIDATQVMGSLPTQHEIDALLQQNHQLLRLWRAEQARAADLTEALGDMASSNDAAEWRQGVQRRLEAALDKVSTAPERFCSELEHEYYASSVLCARDIVQIYILHEEHQSLIREGAVEIPLEGSTSQGAIGRAFASKTVLWEKRSAAGFSEQLSGTMAPMTPYPSASSPSSATPTSTRDPYRSINGGHIANTDSMADIIAYIPLLATSSSSPSSSSSSPSSMCRGVCKVLFEREPSQNIVGQSRVDNLGRLGELSTMIASACLRHYQLYSTQHNLQSRERLLVHERVELVKFLRKNWDRLDDMFALRNELQEMATRIDGETENAVVSAMENSGTANNLSVTSQAELQAQIKGETLRQQHLTAIALRHVQRLLGKKSVRAALYLPRADDGIKMERDKNGFDVSAGKQDEQKVLKSSSSSSSLSSSSLLLLDLVPQILRQSRQFYGDYAVDSQDPHEDHGSANIRDRASSYTDYFRAPDILALVQYVGSMGSTWNSATDRGGLDAWTQALDGIEKSDSSINDSLLCVPIMSDSHSPTCARRCLGVLAIQQVVTAPRGATNQVTSDSIHTVSSESKILSGGFDELDEHTITTYCKHLATVLDRTGRSPSATIAQRRHLLVEQSRIDASQKNTEIIVRLAHSLSVFCSAEKFFRRVSEAAQTVCDAEVSYLFVVGNDDDNNNDDRTMTKTTQNQRPEETLAQQKQHQLSGGVWTMSQVASPGQVVSFGPRELAATVMGEVLRTGKSVNMDLRACSEDPRCANGVDGVLLRNLACVPLYADAPPNHFSNSSALPIVVAVLLVGNKRGPKHAEKIVDSKTSYEISGVDMGLARQLGNTVAPLVQAWLHESAQRKNVKSLQVSHKTLENEVKIQANTIVEACCETLAIANTSTDPETVVRAVRSACSSMLSAPLEKGSSIAVELIIVGERNEDDEDDMINNESNVTEHRGFSKDRQNHLLEDGFSEPSQRSSFLVSVWKLGPYSDHRRKINTAATASSFAKGQAQDGIQDSTFVEETLVRSSRMLPGDRSGFLQAVEQGFASVHEKSQRWANRDNSMTTRKSSAGEAGSDGKANCSSTHLFIKIDLKLEELPEDASDADSAEHAHLASSRCVLKISVPKTLSDTETGMLLKRLRSSCCRQATWLSTLARRDAHASKAGDSWSGQLRSKNWRGTSPAKAGRRGHESGNFDQSKVSALLSLCNELYMCESEAQLALMVRERFRAILPGHATLLQCESREAGGKSSGGANSTRSTVGVLDESAAFGARMGGVNGVRWGENGSEGLRPQNSAMAESQDTSDVIMWSCVRSTSKTSGNALSSSSSGSSSSISTNSRGGGNAVRKVRLTLTEMGGKSPRGITGLAVETGEDMFISDAVNNENFRSDVDLNPQLAHKASPSSNMNRRGVLVHGIGCLPLVDHSGEIAGCLQVFQQERRKRNSKVGSVFSRNQRQLWKTFAICVESVMGRLRSERIRVEAVAQRSREHASMKSKLRQEQILMHQCVTTMQRIQTEEGLGESNGATDATMAASQRENSAQSTVGTGFEGKHSLLAIGTAQRELAHAFEIPCVAIFASESGATSGDSIVWTSVSSSSNGSAAGHGADSNSSIARLSSASIRVRALLASTSTLGQASVVRDASLVQELLNEMPQISTLKSFVRQNKIIVALPTQVVRTTDNTSGARGLILAVGDTIKITPAVVSAISVLGLSVLNAVVLRVAARAIAGKLDTKAHALLHSQRTSVSQGRLLKALASCRSSAMNAASVDTFLTSTQSHAQRLFDVESADLYIFDESNHSFWTLDDLGANGVERREVSANSGSVLGRFSKSDQHDKDSQELPYVTEARAEPVCLTGDLRGRMGQRELPKHVDNPTTVMVVAITVRIDDKLVILGALELINPRNSDSKKGGIQGFSKEDLKHASTFAKSIGFDLFQLDTLKAENSRARQAESLLQGLRDTEFELQTQLEKASIQVRVATGVLNAITMVRTSSETNFHDSLVPEAHGLTSLGSAAGNEYIAVQGPNKDSGRLSNATASEIGRRSSITGRRGSLRLSAVSSASSKSKTTNIGSRGAVSCSSKGPSGGVSAGVPDVVLKVFRSAEAVQTRNSSSQHMSSPPTSPVTGDNRESLHVNPSAAVTGSRSITAEDSDANHAGVSCFPVCGGNKGEVIACLYIEHHSNSSPRRDRIGRRTALGALLSIAANTVVDMQVFSRQDGAIRTLQSERQNLLASSLEDQSRLNRAKLSESVAKICKDALAVQPKNDNALTTIEQLDELLEQLCTRARRALDVDRVYIIYGKTAAASEAWLESTSEFAAYRGVSSHDMSMDGASTARSETGSISATTGITIMSSSGVADDGTNFRVVSDKAVSQDDSCGLSTGHVIDRSSALIGEGVIIAAKGGMILGANRNGNGTSIPTNTASSSANSSSSSSSPSVSFASSLTLFDLKRELGKAVTTGAFVASFSYAAAQGILVCLCPERRFRVPVEGSLVGSQMGAEIGEGGGSISSSSSSSSNNNNTTTSSGISAGKGGGGSSSIQGTNDRVFTNIAKALASSTGLLCERFLESQQIQVNQARADESHTKLTMELDERNSELSRTVAAVTKLSSTASDNASTISQMEAEIKMMEKHLQNEVENRLRGQAVQAMGRALSAWRQTSIQWYFQTWRTNYRRWRRHRYIIVRVTSKMHRGLLSRCFFLWSTTIAEHLRHNRVLRRCIDRIQHMKLYRCFHTWVMDAEESRVIKVKLRQAYFRMAKASLSHAMNTWRGRVMLTRRARKAMKFWTRRILAGHFHNWVSHSSDNARLRNVGIRVVKRFQRLKLAAHFATWLDWHEDVRTNRTTLLRFTSRMSHLAMMRSFSSWTFFVRSRMRMRHRLESVCRIIEGTHASRIRPMWKHWALHVHFTANRILQLERHAARFVQGRGVRTLQRSFTKLQKNARSMQKARRVIQRFQNNIHKRGLRGTMQRWCKATRAFRFESAVAQLENAAQLERDEAEANIAVCERRLEEADKALAEAIRERSDMETANNQSVRALQESLEAAEYELQQIHAAKSEEHTREMTELRECLSDTLKKQDTERQRLKSLRETATRMSAQFENVKETVTRAEDSRALLSRQMSEAKAEMARSLAESQAQEKARMARQEQLSQQAQKAQQAQIALATVATGYRGRRRTTLSDAEISMLKQKVSLLVSSHQTTLDPEVVINNIHRIIHAAGANDKEHNRVFKLMFSVVLELLAKKRGHFVGLRNKIQDFMTKEIKMGRSRHMRRSSMDPSQNHIERTIGEAMAKAAQSSSSTGDSNFDLEHHLMANLGSLKLHARDDKVSESVRANEIIEELETSIARRKRGHVQSSSSSLPRHPLKEDSNNLKTIETSLDIMHSQTRANAQTKDELLQQVLRQEIRALDTELIVADGDQLESYKKAMQKLSSRLSLQQKQERGKPLPEHVQRVQSELEAHMIETTSGTADERFSPSKLMKSIYEACGSVNCNTAVLVAALKEQIKSTLLKMQSIETATLTMTKMQKYCKGTDGGAYGTPSKQGEGSSSSGSDSEDEGDMRVRHLWARMRAVRDKSLAGNFTFQFHKALLSGQSGKDAGIDAVREAFDKADTDGNGSLDKDELGDLMNNLMDSAPSSEGLNAVFNLLDIDGSGDVDFDEFCAWWSSGGGNVDINTKIHMETHLNRFMSEHSGELSTIKVLQRQLSEAMYMQHQDRRASLKKAQQESAETKQKEAHDQRVESALFKVVDMIKYESARNMEVLFQRLSTLDHSSTRDSSHLVNEELEGAMVDLKDLHQKTVEHIRTLEENARSHLDAFHRLKNQMKAEEEPWEDEDHAKRKDNSAGVRAMEAALAQAEHRLEKADLRYARAVDHIRHLHEVVRERRKVNHVKLSQLVAMETVFLGSEGVETDRLKTRFERYKNTTAGGLEKGGSIVASSHRATPARTSTRLSSRQRRQRSAMARLSTASRSGSRAAKGMSFGRKDEGRLLESAQRGGSFVRGAVVHLWGSGI